MHELKNILLILSVLNILNSCSSGTAKIKEASPREDSVIYIPPPPGKVSEQDVLRYRSAIQSFFDTVLLPKGFNGSLIVAKNGVVIFEKYHGYADMMRKDTLNEHSSFHLASVSKTFTAVAILRLAEKGKLSLDDNVKKYFPAFPYDHITIRLLLSHRSGLPNYMYYLQQLGWDVSKFSTNTDMLDYLVNYKPELTSPPGTRFNYCNTNFVLLAMIIEKVTGKSYAEHLQKTIFTPLQMNDTYVFSLADTNKAMRSFDYRGRPEAWTFLDAEYGDKNIYSTPRDLLKWDQALYTRQLLNEKSLEAAFTPYSNEKPGIKNYGYGWRMDIFPDGKKIIFHGGWWHGNNTLLMRLVQDSATIIVLGNKHNRVVYDAKLLANIFQPYFIAEENDKQLGEEPVPSKQDSLLLEQPSDTTTKKLTTTKRKKKKR